YEIAGWEALPDRSDFADFVDALLGTPERGERLEAVDARRGVYRYAVLVEGELDAWLFLTRAGGGAMPARAAVAPLLGEQIAGPGRVSILAGASPDQRASAGRVVCTCFSVGIETLRRAIETDGLATVAEIGRTLQAGTNCGSCVPELR